MQITKALLVTVIMVIRNEEAFIEQSLESVLQQDYPAAKVQVLIVDGMSQDQTRKIVEQIIWRYPQSNLTLLDNPEHIFPVGFNVGLNNATGDVIIMMGGHVVLDADYISRCVDHMEKYPDIDCVGGYLYTIAESPQGKAIALAMSSAFGVGGGSFRTISNRLVEVDTVAFGAYRRRAMDYCGLMDEELVRDQDDEYNYRLREKGGKILISPDIHARYYSRSSVRSLWTQYFEYGLWKVRVAQKHPRQMRPRQFAPLAFVSAIIISVGTTLLGWGWLFLTLVIGVYLLANLTASLLTAFSRGWEHLPCLPLIFATLHLSYGLGSLVGMVKFWNRWSDRHGRVPNRPIEQASI